MVGAYFNAMFLSLGPNPLPAAVMRSHHSLRRERTPRRRLLDPTPWADLCLSLGEHAPKNNRKISVRMADEITRGPGRHFPDPRFETEIKAR